MRCFYPSGTLALFLVVLQSCGIGRDAVAQRPGLPVPQQGVYVEVVRRVDGNPILVINYPWNRHAKPSIEIRFLYEDEAEERLIHPLHFVDRFMKDTISVAIYRAQDGAADVRTSSEFSRGDIPYEIFADRNAVGRASASVACTTQTVSIQDQRPTARAIFPILEPWALDSRTLYLELPRQYFSAPSKLRVWLLRKETVVWAETADWPGYPE